MSIFPEKRPRITTAASTALRKRWQHLVQQCRRAGISAPRRIMQRITDFPPQTFTQMVDPLGPDILADRAQLLSAAMDKLEAMAAAAAASSSTTPVKAKPGLRYTR